jgi:hypothetical protein
VASAITYLARDFNLDHEVAIKEYLPMEDGFCGNPGADSSSRQTRGASGRNRT